MQRVLIVEDEVLIGLVLEDIVEALGASVAANAESLSAGFDALERLGPEGFDVAILDVHLGADAVFPLADRLAGIGKRIVFATGSHPDSLPNRFAGAAVLEKPYAYAAVEAIMQPLSTAA